MIPAYNKKRCAAFPFETGIHFRRKTHFFPEEDTTRSYTGFEPEPTRLQTEGHSHYIGWATLHSNNVSHTDQDDYEPGEEVPPAWVPCHTSGHSYPLKSHSRFSRVEI
ncbi:poly polymerase [Trichonephila clavipes]|nr:poly polymerase [Trichonephila clavipes]